MPRVCLAYTYDYAGRMATMKTWTNRAVNSGAAVTTWYYDLNRGWMTNKVYADGKGTIYSNTPAGRLALRRWARGLDSLYAYNLAGDLIGVDYSDSTPDLFFEDGVLEMFFERDDLLADFVFSGFVDGIERHLIDHFAGINDDARTGGIGGGQILEGCGARGGIAFFDIHDDFGALREKFRREQSGEENEKDVFHVLYRAQIKSDYDITPISDSGREVIDNQSKIAPPLIPPAKQGG